MSSISLSRIPRRFQVLLALALLAAVLWVAVGQKLVGSSSSESGSGAIAARHPAPTRVHPRTLISRGGAGSAATRAKAQRAPAAGSRHGVISRPGSSVRHAVAAAAGHAQRAPATKRPGTLPSARAHAPIAPVRAHAPAVSRAGAGTLAPTGTRTLAPTRAHTQTGARSAPPAASRHATTTLPAASKAVEEELGAGKTVLVLFWTPQAVTDQFVKGEVQAAARSLGSSVVVHYATAAQVAEYGTFTEHVLITETPTLLVIAPPKEIVALAGFTEAETIKRTVAAARSSASAKPARH